MSIPTPILSVAEMQREAATVARMTAEARTARRETRIAEKAQHRANLTGRSPATAMPARSH